MRDVSATTPAEPRQPARIWTSSGAESGRSPGQPTTHIPADLDRNCKRAPSPPRSNGQAFDEARNPVTVAGRRRCRASGRVRPCWDQAFPCYSPLASVVGAPSAGPSGEHPPAGGRALLGSAVRWYPSLTWGHGHGASGECLPHGGRARDGALAASPRLCLRPKPMEVRPCCTASDQAHRDWGRVDPQGFRPMDWLVAPRLARRAQARQSPQRRPRDASFSSVTSDDDHFASSLSLGPARC